MEPSSCLFNPHATVCCTVCTASGVSQAFSRSKWAAPIVFLLHLSRWFAAKYYNGGFVLEQEGDSFTIAFYDPFDAVVFCLQVF